MLLALGLAACENTDDIEKDIDNLQDQIENLEQEADKLSDELEAIRALTKDGMTITELRLDSSTGIYTITLSDGTVLKVKQKLEGSSADSDYFLEVSADDEMLNLTLVDGTEVKVPIVKNFFCYFDKALTEVQQVSPGATAKFNLHLKGAQQTLITAPAGWKATLAAPSNDVAVLTVVAPTTVTRASADNSRDLSVLAISGVYAQIAKLQVEIGEGGTVEPEPEPDPETPTGVVAEITAATLIEAINTYHDTRPIESSVNAWFHRDDLTTATSVVGVDQADLSIKISVAGTKGSWNKSSVVYHSITILERAKYKLSFHVKSNLADGSVGIGIRTADDKRGFRMIEQDGTSLNCSVTTPKAPLEGVIYEKYFDFSYASTAMVSGADKYLEGESPTTDVDVKGINLYFYNNKANSTLYIKDVKLEKVIE